MMNNSIPGRLMALRQYMQEKQLSAFIVPSSDAHLSEYPAAHWTARKWLSGFTGSAGTVVVTADKAGLWTDSRYFLQAAEQLQGSGIDLYKDGLPETPGISQWLLDELPANSRAGVDGKVYSVTDAQKLRAALDKKNIRLVTDSDPFEQLWEDRPPVPQSPIFEHPLKYAGEKASSKTGRINAILEQNNADCLLVAALDTIAWAFNIRGTDVHCNPVGVSYACISPKENILFVDPVKLTPEVEKYLQSEGIKTAAYNDIGAFISEISPKATVCLQAGKFPVALFELLPPTCKILDMPSPADGLKAIKNHNEIEGFRNSMKRDCVALIRFFMWLEESVPAGNVTELQIVDKLRGFRAQSEMFADESFDTISGYAGNGAIVHYSATEESSLTLKPEGFLLLDSGAQYYDGTTDITRTVALGPLTDQMKEDYTLVLKGQIALAQAKFPQGTRGSQLDVLARQFLWAKGLSYTHGTGHGVGSFLNVHEGPQNIRLEENSTTLKPGMLTSNEPGIYRTGQYGIRTENLILTVPCETTEFGEFYCFETLTLCPIDTAPIVVEMLTESEKQWLNSYHKEVYSKVAPLLDEKERCWLEKKTQSI